MCVGGTWQHRQRGLTGDCPVEYSVRFLRQSSAEELLLIHEEPQKVMHPAIPDTIASSTGSPIVTLGDGSGHS